MAAKIDRHRPDHLANLPHFHNLILTEGNRHAHLAGLLPVTAEGVLVGEDDLEAQMAFVYKSIGKTLEGLGATPGHIVRQRMFIKNLGMEHRPIVAKVMNDFYGEHGRPVSTAVGVTNLFLEGALVEIDVTALLD